MAGVRNKQILSSDSGYAYSIAYRHIQNIKKELFFLGTNEAEDYRIFQKFLESETGITDELLR